ncbi:hypothetical protein BCA37_10700 [Mycobacterium sp. djl-10]|nr:hypothetical protein BCA37_10700 [Mycobacterium sp. djl-10]
MGDGDLPRATSNDEKVQQLQRLERRLARALSALAEGEADAVDDVATALRALVGRGPGNDLIRRVRSALGLRWPLLFVGPPASDANGVSLSVGSIPARVQEPPGDRHWVGVNEWTDRLAIVIDQGKGRRKLTWEGLIETYANTYGAHAGKAIPRMLDAASRLYADKLDLGEYLIHCAGLGVADLVGQMLDEIGGNTIVRGQLLRGLLTPLYGLTIIDRPMKDIQVRIDDIGVDKFTYVIKMIVRDGEWARVWIEPDLTGETKSIISLDIHDDGKPDWWPD